ncbi:MAG TPA: nuclear transport factor 2 family protein [Acidimicrobiales bacterium]|nr:nuclear transport factor 2 family protein [Acidimicrobiales bacterium]
MTDADIVAIERACERLVITYTHLVDGGRAAAVADLFTVDGVWSSGGNRLEGREAIRAAFTRRQESDRTSRHVCTNLLVDVIDADHATGLVYLTLYRHDGSGRGVPEPDLVGEYRDRFARTPEGWRFTERIATMAFERTPPPSGG